MGRFEQVATTGGNNQLQSDGVHLYFYDDEGNLFVRFTDHPTSGTPGQLDSNDFDFFFYEWDYRNRLTAVNYCPTYSAAMTNDPDEVVEYFYDYRNRLVRRTLDDDGDGTIDNSTVFIQDGNQIALQFDKTGTAAAATSDLSHRYLWGPAVDEILADEAVNSGADQTPGTADDVLWTLTDHLNTVRDLAEFDGDDTTIENHREFDAFGNLESETNSAIDCIFAFTARLYDETTDLQNNLNRWYDASVGRWLSEDPIGFAAEDANLYRYVGNSTVNDVDPLGLDRRLVTLLLGHAIIEIHNAQQDPIYLEFGPDGFTISDTTEYEIKIWELPEIRTAPTSTWIPSTPAQDQQLIDLWKWLEKERRKGQAEEKDRHNYKRIMSDPSLKKSGPCRSNSNNFIIPAEENRENQKYSRQC